MNNVNLVARLTATPELKSTPSGKSVCNFTLAVQRRFKDTEGKPVVDFIDCVSWGNQAEFICKWFDKGVRVGVTGELQTRTYTDKDGNNRKAVEVLVNTVEFADGKTQASETNNTNTGATVEAPETNDFVPVSAGDEIELPF